MLNPAYKPVSLRAVGEPRGHHDVVMLALDLPGQRANEALRLLLPLDEARAVATALLESVGVQTARGLLKARVAEGPEGSAGGCAEEN